MAVPSTRENRRRAARRSGPPAADDIQTPAKSGSAAGPVYIEPGQRHALICEAAYFRAERRGFCPGQELAAESDIDRTLQPGGADS